MRKLTALVLVLLLTVALSACQAQENNKAANALPRFGQSGDLQNAADKTTGADTVSTAGGDTVKTDATTTDPAPSTTPELITRDRAIELALNEADCKTCSVNRNINISEKIRQTSDMVLVAVGDENTLDF